ncbi:MAG: FAD-dependent oxidoreductase [Deltaproteobacteria bacterium]|nr:FAD-dependent oxidoreductase [Deltaproteobacteria bacterium]
MKRADCDILVIGGGGAGVTAAALAARCGARVTLLSKEHVGRGDTCIASGLMTNGVVNPADHPSKLIRDLVLCGEHLNDPTLVQLLAERSGEATELLEGFGMVFRRNRKGRLTPLPTPLGGHSVARSLAGLAEGNQIGSALRAALYSTGVQVLEEHVVTDLFTDGGRVTGALGVEIASGEFTAWSAKRVILASGGCGWLFAPFTSNMRSNSGDGFTLAFDAGAELRDMEHAQFIFGLSRPESMIGVLVGEPASAGFFGRLLDSDGREIIKRPARKTRGQVSAAIARAMRAQKVGPGGGVFLDLSGNVERMGPAYRKLLSSSRKSALEAVRFAYGAPAARCELPWEVVASFHYLPGGVKVDERCESTIGNLYAIGQVQGGLFGADRLGSVSLTELFVFAKIASEAALEHLADSPQPSLDAEGVEMRVRERTSLRGKSGSLSPLALQRRLQKTMWQKVGLLRDENSLKEALRELETLDHERVNAQVPPFESYNSDWLDLLELGGMIRLGKIIARCALERKESRGGHVRMDHPERDDTEWLKTIVASKENGDVAIRTEPIGDVWDDIRPAGLLERLPSSLQELAIRSLPRAAVQRILRRRVASFVAEEKA